jgi:hypothetical protein
VMGGLVGLSRVRLGLLAAIVVVGLAFSGAAQAAPPDPVTLGATTLSNIRLNGVPGTQLVVAPGANVTITADWSDNNTGCPSCIDNLPVAFQGFGAQPAGCIENHGGDGFAHSGTGTVSLGAAPLTPGTYNIVGNFEETFFCGQFWTVPNTFPVIAQVVVSCTETVSGTVPGPLRIGAGVTCINGGTVAGPVSISAGAIVVLTGATIYGPLNAEGAAQIAVCDSRIAGPVSVRGSSGSVLIGSAATGGSLPCGGNVILGPVTLTGNSGSVELGANTIAGQVTLTGNGGPAAIVAANTIAGPLSCAANNAEPTDNGQPNTVHGPASGQCATLG